MKRELPAYKVTCENGYYWTTSMAAGVTLDDAKKYFIGKYFNTAPYPGEKRSLAIKVEIAEIN